MATKDDILAQATNTYRNTPGTEVDEATGVKVPATPSAPAPAVTTVTTPAPTSTPAPTTNTIVAGGKKDPLVFKDNGKTVEEVSGTTKKPNVDVGIVGSPDPTGKGPGRAMVYPLNNNGGDGDGGSTSTQTPNNTPSSTNPQDMRKAIMGDDTKKVEDDIANGGEPPKVKDYDALLAALGKKHGQPTPEELEKQRKKEKRDKLFAGIGDMVSALSNLYFTTKGAPNSYNHDKSMTSTMEKRWDKIRAQQKEDRQAYLAEYERLMRERRADRDAAMKQKYNDDMMALRQRQLDVTEADKKATQDRNNMLAQARSELYKAQQSKDEAQIAYTQAKTQALVDGADATKAEKIAKAAKAEAEARIAKNKAAGGGSGSGGGTSKKKSGGSGSSAGTNMDKVTYTEEYGGNGKVRKKVVKRQTLEPAQQPKSKTQQPKGTGKKKVNW